MGLLQKAVITYNSHENLVGKIIEGHNVLAPVSHIVTSADIEITIDKDGSFISAVKLDKTEPKILIPVTESSAGRTSAPCAHPLCEQIGYLTSQNEEKYRLYTEQLEAWANSDFSHPKLLPILTYVGKDSVLSDLVRSKIISLDSKGLPLKDKMLIRWRVLGCGEPTACWEDVSLMNSFISWYADLRSKSSQEFCYITGTMDIPAEQHAKGIVPVNGNAKLISSNDSSGFTYRGRFIEPEQAASISYEASQKAHNALRWLIAEQGQQIVFGGRTFLCWNPEGIKIPGIVSPFMRKQTATTLPSDYKKELHDTLIGYKTELPDEKDVVIAAFDAATSGRLSLTYYNELKGSDFLNRLYDWDLHCCWQNGKYGIQSPSLFKIVNAAFGTVRGNDNSGRLETDDRVMKQQIQRLIACRIDHARMPSDIVELLVQRASNPVACSDSIWMDSLYVACAVLNKYLYDYKGVDAMSWELDKKDRSFQYGRLLAVMDKAEKDYYAKTGEDRQTNAMKAMSAFRQHPWRTFERINRQLTMAYLPRLESWQRKRYEILTEEIVGILQEFPERELDARLQDTYLLGYNLQKNEFYKSSKRNDTEE